MRCVELDTRSHREILSRQLSAVLNSLRSKKRGLHAGIKRVEPAKCAALNRAPLSSFSALSSRPICAAQIKSAKCSVICQWKKSLDRAAWIFVSRYILSETDIAMKFPLDRIYTSRSKKQNFFKILNKFNPLTRRCSFRFLLNDQFTELLRLLNNPALYEIYIKLLDLSGLFFFFLINCEKR